VASSLKRLNLKGTDFFNLHRSARSFVSLMDCLSEGVHDDDDDGSDITRSPSHSSHVPTLKYLTVDLPYGEPSVCSMEKMLSTNSSLSTLSVDIVQNCTGFWGTLFQGVQDRLASAIASNPLTALREVEVEPRGFRCASDHDTHWQTHGLLELLHPKVHPKGKGTARVGKPPQLKSVLLPRFHCDWLAGWKITECSSCGSPSVLTCRDETDGFGHQYCKSCWDGFYHTGKVFRSASSFYTAPGCGGIFQVGQALLSGSGGQHGDVNGDEDGDCAGQQIIETLRVTPTARALPVLELAGTMRVSELDLSFAGLANPDLVLVAMLLRRNNYLRKLNLAGNNLSSMELVEWGVDTGVMTLALTIKSTQEEGALGLKHLEMWGNGIMWSNPAGTALISSCASRGIHLR
jgi:hypothetical protein